MRMTLEEALKRRLITPKQGAALKADMAAAKIRRDMRLSSSAVQQPSSSHATYNASNTYADTSPQYQIFRELNEREPGIAMYEMEGLVPGRKFRADIYLPESRLVIEMDGYQFHKSKEQFQKDREKRALLVMRGYPVIGVYYAQVKNDLDNLVDTLLAAHDFYKPFATLFFQRDLELSIRQCESQR